MLRKYWGVFTLSLWLGATIFGGLNAAYPVIKQKVRHLEALSEAEIDGLYAVAVFLPGPSFLNFWGSIANRIGGLPATVIAQVGLLLPAFTVVLVLPLLTRIPWIAAHSDGAQVGAVYATAGLLVATGLEGLKRWKENWAKLLGLSMLLLIFLGVNPLVLLVGGVAMGAARTVWISRKEEG